MYQRKRLASICLLVLFSMVSSGACSKPGGYDSREIAKIREFVKNLVTDIDFYGRVLDQNDQPVIGAEVEIHISYFEPTAVEGWFNGVRTYKARTGIDGRFELTGIRGWEIYVWKISASGYEYDRQQNLNDSFKYTISPDEYGEAFIPDKNNPVIFRMRKKLQDRTFLFLNRDWGLGINRDGSGENREFDIVEGKRIRRSGSSQTGGSDRVCDLRYRAVFDEASEQWTVEFSTCGRAGEGIFVSDEELYEAPEGGYRDEWSFMARNMDLPKAHFLYVKSRTPSIYSRIEITDIRVERENVRMYGHSSTNPYGDRVLDSVDMDSLTSHQRVVLKKQLKAEAKAALREGRLPPRPKIMALIEEAKRTVPLEASARREPSQKDH